MPEPLSGPVDTVAPWTLKAISAEVREGITVAARKEGVTISQWIERRFREWTDTGEAKRITADQTGSSPVRPDQPGVAPSSDTAAGLALIERAVTVAVALASAPDVPMAFRRRANRLLRESLPAGRGDGRGQRQVETAQPDAAEQREGLAQAAD